MKHLLYTGASGFLGHNTLPLLREKYAISTLGITDADDYKANIANEVPQLSKRYDTVLHAAGKAHVVPRTEEEIKAFYDVNYQGTLNLCLALEKVGVPQSLIFVSTVAVYGCETGEGIEETHPLNGTTPYAKSKIMAEEHLQKWCAAHGVMLSIIRPSLIIGQNAPGNLGAMAQGIRSGKYLSIAGGKARKSMLMVQDVARLVPLLEEKGGVYNVCDSRHPSFRELEQSICQQIGKKGVVNVPYWFAKSLALVGDLLGSRAPINSDKLTKITSSLTFSNEKAKRELGWEPLDVLAEYRV